MWDSIKALCVTAISAVCAYLEPINNVIVTLFILSGLDILFGIISGIAIDNERFRFKKFILSCIHVLIYLGVATLIYTIGMLQDDFTEAMMIVKTVTYIFIYFYSSNILRNIHKLFPDNRIIGFLDYIIGFEFAKRIPQLSKFLNKNKSDKTENNEQVL